MHKTILKNIWDAIWWEDARDARDISEEAGVDPGRTCEVVRAAVRQMRDQGLPIVSDGYGFKKTISASELVKCARMMFSKADAIRKRGEGLLQRVEEAWSASAYQEEAERMFCDDND